MSKTLSWEDIKGRAGVWKISDDTHMVGDGTGMHWHAHENGTYCCALVHSGYGPFRPTDLDWRKAKKDLKQEAQLSAHDVATAMPGTFFIFWKRGSARINSERLVVFGDGTFANTSHGEWANSADHLLKKDSNFVFERESNSIECKGRPKPEKKKYMTIHEAIVHGGEFRCRDTTNEAINAHFTLFVDMDSSAYWRKIQDGNLQKIMNTSAGFDQLSFEPYAMPNKKNAAPKPPDIDPYAEIKSHIEATRKVTSKNVTKRSISRKRRKLLLCI